MYMILEFTAKIIEWRGPAPYYYVPIPPDESDAIRSIAKEVTYGWGVIPVHIKIGSTEFKTSLFPKDGGYLIPLKDAVRKPEKLSAGDAVDIYLEIR